MTIDVASVRDYWEIEGIDSNTATNQMRLFANIGMRRLLGMLQDYYPVYTREICELYLLNILDGN